MKIYNVFVLQGYDSFNKETGAIKNVTEYEIIADNLETAEKIAKKLYKKNGYRVKSVIQSYIKE